MTVTLRGRVAAVARDDPRTDADLLARFVEAGDDGAFAVLVRRYAPAVRAACRVHRLSEADADDVFQTTFLELVRKAERIRVRAALGGWVYRVAERAANRLRRRRPAAPLPDELPGEPRVAFDDADVVMEEVARLPEKYRQAVAFCYLGGKTTADAAAELGWAKGTVLTRLAWARKRLHDRLTRRGVALGSVAISVVSARGVAATVAAARRRLDAPPAGLFPFFNNWKEAMFIPKLIAAVGLLVAVAAGVWPNGHAGAEQPAAKAEVPKAKANAWVGTWVKEIEVKLEHKTIDGRAVLTLREDTLTLEWDGIDKGGRAGFALQADYAVHRGTQMLGVIKSCDAWENDPEKKKPIQKDMVGAILGQPVVLPMAIVDGCLVIKECRTFGQTFRSEPAKTESKLSDVDKLWTSALGKFTRVDPARPLPPLKPAEPPTDTAVLRALPKPKGVEVFRDDITITKIRVGLRGEDGKVTWECAVYYDEVTRTPDGAVRKPHVQVVAIRQ